MFKNILDVYNHFEKITNSILKTGLRFCGFLCLISIVILSTYLSLNNPNLYYIGITVFKLSIIFGIEFIICGFVVDGIKKQAV